MMEIKYGEKEILEFDINNTKKIFGQMTHEKNYTIDIELPEFMAKCPEVVTLILQQYQDSIYSK